MAAPGGAPDAAPGVTSDPVSDLTTFGAERVPVVMAGGGWRTWHGWMLRVLLGLAVGGTLAIVMAGAVGVGMWSVAGVSMLAVGIGTVLVPGTVLPLLLLLGVVLYRLAASGPVLGASLAALLALVALIHHAAGLAAVIPLRSECEWAALRPALVRYAVAVGVSELVYLAAVAAA